MARTLQIAISGGTHSEEGNLYAFNIPAPDTFQGGPRGGGRHRLSTASGQRHVLGRHVPIHWRRADLFYLDIGACEHGAVVPVRTPW